MKQRHLFINLVIIIMLASMAFGVSLVGLAGLAQAAPAIEIGNDPREFIAPANIPLRQGVVLTVTKSAEPDPVTAGSVLTYTISVVNGGDVEATNVVVTDTLPTSVTVASADGGSQNAENVVWNVGSISVGGTITRTLLVTVGDVISGALLNNTVVVTSDEGIGDSDTLATTVTTSADLVITKEDAPDPLFVGDLLIYTLTVTNNGPSIATGVVVTDTLPLSVTPSSASAGCSESSGVVSCNIGNLNSGATKTVTITVISTSPGVLTNTAVVSSTVTDPVDNNNASAETTVNPKADLAISKIDSPDPITAGTSLAYTLTITNNGPSPAENVVVTDTLPLSMSLQSATSPFTQNGQQLSWNLGSLTLGATRTITIVAKVGGDVRNSIQNTATVTSTTIDLTLGNNSHTESTTVNTKVDLTLTKTDSPDDPAVVPFAVNYTLTITNSGPSDATGVVLTDTLPAEMIFASDTPDICNHSSGTVNCNFGTIKAGSNAQVVIKVNPTVPGIFTNTATVGAIEPDQNTADNTDTENTTVNPVNLSVTKTDSPDPVLVENTLTYILTVENDGPNGANNVVLTDTLPSGVTFKSATGTGASCNHNPANRTVTCTLGNIQPRTVTIVVTPTVTGIITNTASVTSNNPDSDLSDNTTSITTTVDPVANLAVAKIDSTDPVTAGTNLTYTLTVTNSGPSPATGVVVTDPLPAGVAYVSASPGCSNASNTVTCSLGGIASGTAVTASIQVLVNPSTMGVITNTVSVTGSEFDPNTVNNSAAITTTVHRKVNLSLAKSSAPNPVAAGSSLTYTLTVFNSGPSSATNVIINDTLPSGVTFASASPACSHSGGNIVTCLSNVASGGTVTASIRVTVASSIVGVITNTATVTSTEADLNLTDNTVTATTTVTRVTDLIITNSDSPDPVTQGNNLTYNLTVINNGPSDATSVSTTQTLPAGVTFQSVTPGSPTCSHAGGVVSCNLGPMAKGNNSVISVVVKVNPTTGGNISSTANVTVTGSGDPNTSNNSAVATTFVNGLNRVYLPAIIKPAPTDLSVFNNNTGGNVIFTVLGTGVSCTVPNNTTLFCGSFPPGTYTVQVSAKCGSDTFSKIYGSGPDTTTVFCN